MAIPSSESRTTTVTSDVRGGEVRGAGQDTFGGGYAGEYRRGPVRDSTEARRALGTTEFWVLVASVIATLFAGYADSQFNIEHAWTIVGALCIGYMLSRGIAKAGSRDPYMRDDH
jgi:hypothetical protein